MLFANSQWIGTFKGFSERGLEFAAEIVAPYDTDMLDRPQLGQFLLVELGSQDEAALGRITRFVPTGLLATSEGEDYVNTMQRRGQAVPEDLKKQRLKYRVQIKLLGAVRMSGKDIVYVPSQRRLPHLGAQVALPSEAVLQKLCGLSGGSSELGTYVLGEFNFCGAGTPLQNIALRAMDPKLTVYFDVNRLVSRRSFVFARAGYGKSNLIKFLIAELYKNPPESHGRPVGTLIFDADGEYFWPDAKGRPGLCDVPQLHDRLIVFTNRQPRNLYYASWKAGNVRLDLRLLPAYDVISIVVSPDRQSQQNVLKLKSLGREQWRRMIDLIYEQGLAAPDEEIGALLGYEPKQVQQNLAEIAAAKSNMVNVVRALHDPNSRLLDGTLRALREGCVVVVDISLLNSAAGKLFSGLVMRRIFSHNQENFTGEAGVIPVIAIIEEAQSVLGRKLDDTSPFVEWVKEGRKYDLGSIMITQQPGSMAPELLSQGDNWFAFHLLSESDAKTLNYHNAHFSDDVLSHLIGEPIPGNCYMWSAPAQPFVLPVRISDFEALYGSNINTEPNASAVRTFVERLDDLVSKQVRDLTARLRTKFCSERLHKLTNADGEILLGVKDGRLYHLIQDIKDPSDPTRTDDLKKLLFDELIPNGLYTQINHNGTNYFAAPPDLWDKALGQPARIRQQSPDGGGE